MFKTSNGWLTLSLADGATLAKAFDDPKFDEWTKDDQFDRREAVNSLVASHMVERSMAEWEEVFVAHGVGAHKSTATMRFSLTRRWPPISPLLSLMIPRPGACERSPIRFATTEGQPVFAGSLRPSAKHTSEVLQELGYKNNEIESLRQRGAIGPDRSVTAFDRRAAAPASAYSRKSKATR